MFNFVTAPAFVVTLIFCSFNKLTFLRTVIADPLQYILITHLSQLEPPNCRLLGVCYLCVWRLVLCLNARLVSIVNIIVAWIYAPPKIGKLVSINSGM